MTSSAKAPTLETPTARHKRVWDKSAASYDMQIAFFEKSGSAAAGNGSARARAAGSWRSPSAPAATCPAARQTRPSRGAN
jgi:hypothetical protein